MRTICSRTSFSEQQVTSKTPSCQGLATNCDFSRTFPNDHFFTGKQDVQMKFRSAPCCHGTSRNQPAPSPGRWLLPSQVSCFTERVSTRPCIRPGILRQTIRSNMKEVAPGLVFSASLASMRSAVNRIPAAGVPRDCCVLPSGK